MVKYVSTGTFLRKKEENLVGHTYYILFLVNKYYLLNCEYK